MGFIKRNSISLHNIFKNCADSTVRLFLPIIIYAQTQSLALTFVYFIVQYFLWWLFNLIFQPLFKKQTLLLVIVHFIPWIIVSAYVTFLPINIGGVLLLAALSALAGSLYAVPMNIIFPINKRTNNVAKFDAASQLGKIIFVIMTGYVIGSDFKDSFLLLMIVGTGLYVLSSLPLIINGKEINGLLKNIEAKPLRESIRINKKYHLLNMFFAIFKEVLDFLLPVYLYYFNFNIKQVSYVIVLSCIAKIVAGFVAKHLQSREKDKVLVLITCLFYAVVVALTPFIKDVSFYYAASIAVPISIPVINTVVFSKYIGNIQANNDLVTGQVTRDVFILPSRAFVYVLFFAFGGWAPMFILGVLSSFGIVVNNYALKRQPVANKSLNMQNEQVVQENFNLEDTLHKNT